MNGNGSSTGWSARRRIAVASIVAVAIALAFVAVRFLRAGRTAERGRAPVNVILITLDTLRTDRLSCYGSTTVQTPHIDAFAAEGVRFTSAASTVPLTLPAHASMMTGLYPPGHGIRDNVGDALDSRIPTLAGRLRQAGWRTGGFVSAFVLDRRWGIARGFDDYDDDFDLRAMAGGGAADAGSVQRDGAETIARAVEWLDGRRGGQPFFLWLHLFDPHDPYTPKEPFASRYPGRPYDAEVAYTDSLVGEFRRALEARGLLDGSLVILTSDHGEGLGDHGESTHGFLVYDSTVKAALIVRRPFGEGAGRVVPDAVSHVDLMPTILDLAGFETPANVHGRSLSPLLAGHEAEDRPVYSESLLAQLHYGWAPLVALRAGGFKLIDAPRSELYDLARDPGERENLRAAERDRARELTVALAGLRQRMETRRPVPNQAPRMDEETQARLRSLGYLAGRSGAHAGDDGRSRIDPKDRLALHEKITAAQGLLGRRETDAARRLLEAVVAEDDAIADAHAMLGEIETGEGRPERAIARFQRALALNADDERSLFGLASAYAAVGRDEDALTGYRRILEIDGFNARAALAIADLYVARGRFDDAAAALERASAKDGTSPFFLNKLGEVRAEQRRDHEAMQLFERAIAADPGFALPHFNLAVIQEKRGDAAAATAHYERAVTIEPGFCRAQFNLGRLRAARGDAGSARQLWEASLRSCPDFIQGHYYLAKLLMDTGGDLVRAETLVRRGIAMDPSHREGPLGYYVLADLLNRTGRPDEGRRATAKGLEIQRSMR